MRQIDFKNLIDRKFNNLHNEIEESLKNLITENGDIEVNSERPIPNTEDITIDFMRVRKITIDEWGRVVFLGTMVFENGCDDKDFVNTIDMFTADELYDIIQSMKD